MLLFRLRLHFVFILTLAHKMTIVITRWAVKVKNRAGTNPVNDGMSFITLKIETFVQLYIYIHEKTPYEVDYRA